MKKYILLITFLFFTLNLSSCDREPKESSQIIFSEADAVMSMRGYAAIAQIDTMSFFFRYDDYEANLYFIHTTKELMASIENYITLPRHPLRIHLTDGDVANYAIGGRELAIYSHLDKNTLGWLVNFMFSGRIPVWLSVGIEAVAKSDIGLFIPDYYTITVPDHFGDLPFNPGFWGKETNKNAINTTYHFVRHLIEINELEGLIEHYLSRQDEWDQANILANQMFYNYFGYELDVSIVLDYINIISARNSYRLTIPSYLNVYNFIFSCFSQYRENIIKYVDALDSATLWTVNWYSQFVELDLQTINTNIFAYGLTLGTIGSAVPSGKIIHIYNFLSGPGGLATMVHEVSHSINGQINRPPIPPFDEGLADVLMLKFIASEYATNYPSFFLINPIQHLFRYDPSKQDLLSNPKFRELNMNFRAYYRLNHTDYIYGGGPFGGGFNGEIGFGFRYTSPNVEHHIAAINTYSTALSFVHYLITTYGLEYYMQVHWDYDNFENIYGRTIHEIIEDWRSFLINLAVEEWDIFNELRDMEKEPHRLHPEIFGNITWSESWGQLRN